MVSESGYTLLTLKLIINLMWKLKKERVDSLCRNNFKKKCTKCEKLKDYFDFYINKKRVDGRSTKCIKCINKYANSRIKQIKEGTIKAF
jgi:hypothetical protein